MSKSDKAASAVDKMLSDLLLSPRARRPEGQQIVLLRKDADENHR